VYRELGRRDEALRAYERAIEVDPDYWVAHQNLGVLYKEMGRVGDAVREFKKATRLSMRAPASAPRRGCLGPAAAIAVLGAALLLTPLLLSAR
ncbi:MAG: tetratricopeptide repeat protein, partial [Armatimonadota bacterium]|nr:tetratricopeptide repeat protein [Armatimonadota bacterium]